MVGQQVVDVARRPPHGDAGAGDVVVLLDRPTAEILVVVADQDRQVIERTSVASKL